MRDTFLQDLRFAIRAFLRAPRFTVPAVLALALGIGATSAIFTVVRGVILKPLPYRDPDRIVAVWENNTRRNRSRNVIASANFVAWGERNKSFLHLGMVGPTRLSVMFDGVPEEMVGLAASSEVFAALGVQAAHGRVFTAEEDLEGNDLVILLSHEFWQSRLAGKPDVLGSTIVTNGRPRNVVGIMPPGFTIEGQKADFMVPYGWRWNGCARHPVEESHMASPVCVTGFRSNRREVTCGASRHNSNKKRRSGTPDGRSRSCRFTSRWWIRSGRPCWSCQAPSSWSCSSHV